jgi:hypothetical protein
MGKVGLVGSESNGSSVGDNPEAILLCPQSRVIGKFDGSGVSGSTGRGRSQALESKVRFADKPAGTPSAPCSSLNKCIGLFTTPENGVS